MTRGRRDSPYEPDGEILYRLQVWKHGCDRRLTVRQIADRLGITPATLVRSVYRARERGHELAVRHPLADTYSTPDGYTHTVKSVVRAQRVRRLAGECEATHDAEARDTLRDEGASRTR